MRDAYLYYANKLHVLTGWACGLFLSVLIVSEILVVILRLLSVGSLALQDLGQYAFALLIMFAIPFVVWLDRHVRVDIFRKKQSGFLNSKIDFASYVVFLFPVFAVILYLALPDLIYSWTNAERSPQIGGLPFYFIVKTGVPIASILVCIQGFAWLLESKGNLHDSDQ